MTSEDIRNRTWTSAERLAIREAAELQAIGDDSQINYDDIPRLTQEQLAQMVRSRDLKRKVPVSVRLDPEVLTWLKSKGDGHLTRINDILHNLMDAEKQALRR
ncbi:MAG: BrnA antitoxin family protein [Bryobacteraceae bacterium]|nr:BrnA antitoxin family protein [Bryobacteraceae bacterium]